MPKNLLVQYKGGGYDGCFWEWNFFLFDENGSFHDIFSSGSRGIRDGRQALELLKDPSMRSFVRDPHLYKYRLNIKKDLKEFQAETSASYVARVVQAVNEIYKRPVMYWACDHCLTHIADGDMHHDGYRGAGGLAIQMLGKLCTDCYYSGLCGYCGEFYGADELDLRGYCNDCAKREEKE